MPHHPTIAAQTKHRSTSAFTLLEVVLAVAVAAFVLTAATTYLISVIHIWNGREERHFFEDHVDGVTEFLTASFSAAGYQIGTPTTGSNDQTNDSNDQTNDSNDGQQPPDTDTPPSIEISPNGESTKTNQNSETQSLLTRASAPISWQDLPGAAGYDDPLLAFSLTTRPPLFVSKEQLPFTKTQIYLHFDREDGLSMLWSSNLQEEVEDINDLRRTQLSPLVTDMIYIYWDEQFEKWEELEEPKDGEGPDDLLLPRYLKLIFEYNGVTAERLLTIPVPATSALIY